MIEGAGGALLIAGAAIAGSLAEPAKKAVGKLVGAYTDLGVAKVRSREQAVKDEAAANTVLSKALAKAAAERAIQDPALVERTLQRIAVQELSKQENREAVARIAQRWLGLFEQLPVSR